MRLLRIIETLDPRRGGPAAGLRAITPALAALGHETEFVCLDDPMNLMRGDLPSRSLTHALGPSSRGYGYTRALPAWLGRHAADFDAVFVHGLWQYHGLAVMRALRHAATPYFVFPHGMLDPWFKRAYPIKHAKKWLYWQFAERHVLRHAAAVLFTCEKERQLARRTFRPYRCVERVVSYGTAGPPPAAARPEEILRATLPGLGDRPYWLFLSRVHPKKGVDLLIDAYGRRAAETPGAQLPALVVAGPVDDEGYGQRLRDLTRRLPTGCAVHWAGMVAGDTKWTLLRHAEAFVLPSHQENFGISVVEAMAVGTPVLISHEINIALEIVADGAGIAAADTAAGTLELLRAWGGLDGAARAAMAASARAAFVRRYEVSQVARSLVDTITPFLQPQPA